MSYRLHEYERIMREVTGVPKKRSRSRCRDCGRAVHRGRTCDERWEELYGPTPAQCREGHCHHFDCHN